MAFLGLLKDEHKIYVSSVAYNLAGPIQDRPNFLKSVVLGSVLKGHKSISDDVVNGHLSGPGLTQKAFYRWSKANYPEGTCEGRVNQERNVSKAVVESEITPPVGGSVDVKAAVIDTGDIVFWAESWLLDNDPANYASLWVATYDDVTNNMTIDFAVGANVVVSYPAFSSNAKYVYAYYEATSSGGVVTPKLFIYKLGGANVTLNGLDANISLKPELFPVIPLRIANRNIDHADFAADYAQHAMAYEKATGSLITEILTTIDANPDIGDIDHAFIVHGVEINTTEKWGKQYLYKFFKTLIADQKTTPLDLSNWITAALGYTTQKGALKAWKAARSDPLSPLYGTARPTVPMRQDLEATRFQCQSTSALRYETHLGWVTIEETIGSGLGKPGAKTGQLWFEILAPIEIPGVPFDVTDEISEAVKGTLTRFKLFWQKEASAWTCLTIHGMFHQNFVYKGKTVIIDAAKALEEVEQSGFIVPLHYPTLTSMSLAASTQLSISNRHIVFNCYQVVIERWYENTVFQIVVVLVITAAVAIFFPAAIGLLGSNLAVGVALGATGAAALALGAVVNAVAAMVLTAIITEGGQELFGEETGAIIGVVASLVAFQYVQGFATTGTVSFNLSEVMKAENLLKLTNALATGFQEWAQVKVGEVQDSMAADYEDYQADMSEIEAKRQEMINSGNLNLDPLWFLETTGSEALEMRFPESSSAFLARTLMTGSEIAQTSIALVRDYTGIALQLPKPIL